MTFLSKLLTGFLIGTCIGYSSIALANGPMVGGGGLDPSIVIACPSGLQVVDAYPGSSNSNVWNDTWMWVKRSANDEFKWESVKVGLFENVLMTSLFYPFCSQVLVQRSQTEWELRMSCEGRAQPAELCTARRRN